MRNGNGASERPLVNSLYRGLERRTMRGLVRQVGNVVGWVNGKILMRIRQVMRIPGR